MAGPAALILGITLILIASTAVTSLLRPEGRLDAAVTGGVVALALIVVSGLGAGVAGVLRPGALLGLAALEALVPIALLMRLGRLPSLRASRRMGLSLRAAPWESAVVGLAALALAWQLLVALVLPPYAYDALSYHLTTVATWVQSGSLARSPLSVCCSYYPSNAEVVFAWPLVLLGNDLLVDTVQVAAAVLAGAAVACLGRTSGLSRRGSAAAGALFVVSPIVLAQAPTAYVDVLQTALILAGLHGLTRFVATAGMRRLALPAICAGLLAGTKGTGLLWSVVLILSTAAVGLVHVRRGRLSASGTIGALAAVLATCTLLGGWWYLRNGVDTGNPLYPFRISLAGHTLFDGPESPAERITPPPAGAGRPWPIAVVGSWASDLLPWRHGSYDYQQRAGGLGPVWPWLGVPLLLPAVVVLWRRRSPVLVATAPLLVVLLLQPYRWWARFTLPLLAIGLIGVLVVIEELRPAAARAILRGGTIGLAFVGAGLVLIDVNPASRATPLPAWRVLGLVGAPAQQRSLGRLFFPEYRFLELVPSNATVVVDLQAAPVRFVYPLYGPKLTRRVVPAGPQPPPSWAWAVTARGRPLDSQFLRNGASLVSDVKGVRVWAPRA